MYYPSFGEISESNNTPPLNGIYYSGYYYSFTQKRIVTLDSNTFRYDEEIYHFIIFLFWFNIAICVGGIIAILIMNNHIREELFGVVPFCFTISLVLGSIPFERHLTLGNNSLTLTKRRIIFCNSNIVYNYKDLKCAAIFDAIEYD